MLCWLIHGNLGSWIQIYIKNDKKEKNSKSRECNSPHFIFVFHKFLFSFFSLLGAFLVKEKYYAYWHSDPKYDFYAIFIKCYHNVKLLPLPFLLIAAWCNWLAINGLFRSNTKCKNDVLGVPESGITIYNLNCFYDHIFCEQYLEFIVRTNYITGIRNNRSILTLILSNQILRIAKRGDVCFIYRWCWMTFIWWIYQTTCSAYYGIRGGCWVTCVIWIIFFVSATAVLNSGLY